MYDGSNPVSITPENMGINEEDDLFIDKKNYRKKIRNLKNTIRPIGNSPDYNEIQNKNLYRSLIPYNNHNYDLEENHNHNYSDFIHDFNMIHPPNNNELLHPPNQNNQGSYLLHPPDYNNNSFYDENGDLNPDIRNIQEYYQNHRDSDMFYNPLRSDNIIHPPNHEDSSLPPARHSFLFLDDNLRNDFIQHPNTPLTPIEELRQALRMQRKKRKRKRKDNN
jgi:hypothetical protein